VIRNPITKTTKEKARVEAVFVKREKPADRNPGALQRYNTLRYITQAIEKPADENPGA